VGDDQTGHRDDSLKLVDVPAVRHKVSRTEDDHASNGDEAEAEGEPEVLEGFTVPAVSPEA
jgi:hypothetical protein